MNTGHNQVSQEFVANEIAANEEEILISVCVGKLVHGELLENLFAAKNRSRLTSSPNV